jgi:hypothetical protein
MAKKIKVIIKQGLKIGGIYPALESEVEIEGTEAKRLLELGAVALPVAKIEAAEPPAKPKEGKKAAAEGEGEAELVAQILATKSEEELIALVPDDEKRPAVVEAATAKFEEFIAAQK